MKRGKLKEEKKEMKQHKKGMGTGKEENQKNYQDEKGNIERI